MDDYRGRGLTGVFHCFSGSEDEARKLLSFDGFYLGIGGVVTYKKSTLPSVLRSVPLERVVLETDSPYLAPVPKRGKRNESAYVPHIADFLAAVYDCNVEQVAAMTTANARTLFPKIAKL
jgi:TatD DNase family protein